MNTEDEMTWRQTAGRDKHYFKDLRALVVDDDGFMRSMACNMMEKIGFRVVDTAEDGGAALDTLNLSRYDVVLTDYEMPVMDGSALATWVKQHHGHTKVVMMTGCDSTKIEALIHTGIVHALLFKPFSLGRLDAVLKDVLGAV